MKEKQSYAVDIFRLKPGAYTYAFRIDDQFFKHFPDSPVNSAKGGVDLNLIKQENLIEAVLDIQIDVPLVCDRSLREYLHRIEEKHTVLFKFGEEEMEMDDDVYVITANTQRIDFSQFIYEFIVLAIPMKKIHPELAGEESVMYSSDSGQTGEDDESAGDPRWDILKKLKKE